MTRTRFKRGDVAATTTPALSRVSETDPLFGKARPAYLHRPRASAELKDRPVLAVTGLQAEARIAAGPGITVVSSGGDTAHLEALLTEAIAKDVCAIISFGIAGGLAPDWRPGSALVARRIVTESGDHIACDWGWAQRLSKALGGMPIADIAGVDAPITEPQKKLALHQDTGAVAVDMESHIAARIAARHGLPFAAFRVIADPAERQLPHAAIVGMRPDGKVALGPLFGSLLRAPRQVPQLARTALDAGAAFATLLRCRKMIAGGFGFGDFGELLLDVPREDVVCRSLPI